MTWLPTAGELIAERFELEREIARGGMGAIWRAHHIRLDCAIAVKFIDPALVKSDVSRERFQREARAAARLRGRHVVQILDYGVWHGAPYIAMELLEGETLADRLERDLTLTIDETVELLEGVVRALTTAAELEIVHRDLKPENVFIVSEGGQEYAKVLDFGVAKLRDPNLLDSRGRTKTGMIVGTPYYMSPEQADGTKTVDHRSDLWALAVIVFECLTGELPFYSEAFGNLVLKITSGPIPLPSELRGDLPSELDDWWRRAVDRDPEQRFQSASELFEALCLALDRLAEARPSGRFTFDRIPEAHPSSRVPFDRLPTAIDRPAAAAVGRPHRSARTPSADRPTSDPPGSHPLASDPPASSSLASRSLASSSLATSRLASEPPASAPSVHGTFGGHARSELGAGSSSHPGRWIGAAALAAVAAGALVFFLRDPAPPDLPSPAGRSAPDEPALVTEGAPASEAPAVPSPSADQGHEEDAPRAREAPSDGTPPSEPKATPGPKAPPTPMAPPTAPSKPLTPPAPAPPKALPAAPPGPPAPPPPNPRLPDDI